MDKELLRRGSSLFRGGAYVNFLMGDEGEERVKKLTAITTKDWPLSKPNTIRTISFE